MATLAFLGRSHRAADPKAQLKEAIDRTARLLGVPADYRVGIVPASDTGAFEMAMWSMLGARPVDMLAWESFGEGWATDAVKQLKLADCRVLSADYGALPDLAAVRPDADVCFTWNGTTSGARVPDADWIAADRAGLTFCDATSAAFARISTGASSTSPPSPGRRRWAARAGTACWSSAPGRSRGSRASPRTGRCRRSSG